MKADSSRLWHMPLVLGCCVAMSVVAYGDDQNEFFEQQVAPLLISQCLECHGSNTLSGGLLLTTEEGLRTGGDSGPALDGGSASASLLLQRVASGEMPPPQQGHSRQLPDADIATLTAWIEQGADWPTGRVLDLFEQTTATRAGRDWWALQPIVRPDPPAVADSDFVRTPIDAFIAEKLGATGLTPAPIADPRTRLRRLHYDLTGLPPTYEELEAFTADPSEANWEAAIDRLLASPHYGERWGRYWLDVVRYADTSGYERDQEKPFAWRYRDWVVEAFNSDMPYNDFVVAQIAGDELADRTEADVIATGFLRLGTWNDEPNDPEDYKYERLEDMVHATSSAFLGLTVKCSRCHDHKFDPIPQLDYYRMAAAFWPGPIEPRERELLGGPSAEELGFPEVLGWTDVRAEVPPLNLLEKGERHRPGAVVEAEPLSFLPDLGYSDADPAGERSTGRRLHLAEWIASDENPLTPRVIVNRIWMHHFGEGLVRSPNNFGFQGDRPTHPELLDWLAGELVANGWHIKPLHKLILMSSTWQQSTVHPDWEAYSQIDAANRSWWHAERRRLDAEGMRDSMLNAAGTLDLHVGGPGFRPDIAAAALEGLSRKDADWAPSSPEEQRRRSLYIFNKRGLLPPLMTTFDQCDTTLPCGQRDVTIVPSQALTLLNNPFAHDCSRELASRIAGQSSDTQVQIETAWRLTLGRDPETAEQQVATTFLADQSARYAAVGNAAPEQAALESLCHALLNSNEFVYID